MLSKLALIVSEGRYDVTSMSRPKMARTAAAYSARFMRWNDRRPGFRFTTATRSTVVSSAVASAVRVAGSSFRDAVRGGIMPVRSLRMTFSVTSACSAALPASNAASDKSPALARSLWQPTQ